VNSRGLGFDLQMEMRQIAPIHREGSVPDQSRTLLDLLARQGGVDPLAAAVAQHADMVYATCRRVLGNDTDAADVAQETFFQLLRNYRRIRGSVGAWLHQVATNRSIDLVRRDTSRRRREEAYAAQVEPGEETWRGIEPLVDAALEALPAAERDLLVRHYLQRQSMGEIGRNYGVSQPTISRRINAALESLRDRLRGQGVVVGTVGLATLLAVPAQAAPAPFLQALGKMVLAHAAGTAGASATATSLSGVGAKSVGILAALGLVVGTGIAFHSRHSPVSPTNAPPSTVTFGFATSVSWTIGPGGQGARVVTSGTNFIFTNTGPATVHPADPQSLSPRR